MSKPGLHDWGAGKRKGNLAGERQQEHASPSLEQALSSLSQEATSVLRSFKSGDHSAIGRHAEKLRSVMVEIIESKSLERIRAEAALAVEQGARELPDQLKQFCETQGCTLSGAFPDYIFDGVLYLGIDVKNCEARLGDSKERLFPIASLLERLSAERHKLHKESFDPEAFLKRLRKAHQGCLENKSGDGNTSASRRVSIFELLARLAFDHQTKTFQRNPIRENFKPYSRHDLRSDLFRLLSIDSIPVVEGRRLILEPTSVVEDGLFMFLPTLGRCAFVGHVVFVPIEQEQTDGC